MTQRDFHHILASVDALSPDQMRRLLQALEGRITVAAQCSATAEAAVLQRMMDEGLIAGLPDTEADFDDPADQPVTIQGEPLSETVVRERR